jgi:hypothetical protein
LFLSQLADAILAYRYFFLPPMIFSRAITVLLGFECLLLAKARPVGAHVIAAPSQHLQALLAVARRRSFSGAARELGVTRSAVSQAARKRYCPAVSPAARTTSRTSRRIHACFGSPSLPMYIYLLDVRPSDGASG